MQGDGCALTTPWGFSDLVAATSLVWPSGDCLICSPFNIFWSCGSTGECRIGGLVVFNVLWNVHAAFCLLLKSFCSKCWGVIVSSLSFQPNNADGVHICNPTSLSADFNGWLTRSFISWLNLTEWRLAKTDEVFRCWSILFSGSMTAGRNWSWTWKFYIFLVKCPLKHRKLFDFLCFKLWEAWSHVGYNWFKVLQRVKTSPKKPPAAWSAFFRLFNCLFCSFNSYGAT